MDTQILGIVQVVPRGSNDCDQDCDCWDCVDCDNGEAPTDG
jgi:hypothetical protein